jgi:hypothetical protein
LKRKTPVTEVEWLNCTDPQFMLEFLRGKVSDRKFRLFAVACCRRLLHEVRVHAKDVHAVDVAERYADGESTAAEMEAAATYVWGPPSARRTAAFACRDTTGIEAGNVLADCTAENAAWAAGEHAAFLAGLDNASPEFASARAAEKVTQIALLQEVLGPVPFHSLRSIAASILTWNDGCVATLATAIYQERAFDRLPILGDALEDAGCTDADILNHCRGPGPHTRGCWVVDLVLGKE